MNRVWRTVLDSDDGFSLIEVIVVLTVGSVLFTMMFAFYSSAVPESSAPVINYVQSISLTQVGERITARYREDRTLDLNTLKDSLDDNPGDYGSGFTVVTNEFIKFSGNDDTPVAEGETEDILKVKLQQDTTNETLVLLFTREPENE